MIRSSVLFFVQAVRPLIQATRPQALNSLGIAPWDSIAILQAIKEAGGALQAQFVMLLE